MRPDRAVSVVVPNWNGLRFLDDCLESVLGQEVDGGVEVILVDNASTDGSPAHVRRRFPAVRVIEAGANLGFSAGCNLGIRAARGRHVVLLDNDSRARPGWLQALLAAAGADPEAGAIASKLLLLGRTAVLNGAGLVLFDDGFGANRGWEEPDRGQFEVREEVFGAPGNGMLLNRRALAEVGLLDESFFAYYDDADLCWRMRRAGWRVLYEPRAVVDHVHSGSLGSASDFFAFHVNRNRLLMVAKNGSPALLGRVLARPGWLVADHARPQGALKARVAASLAANLPRALAQRRGGPRRVARAAVEARWLTSRTAWDAGFESRTSPSILDKELI